MKQLPKTAYAAVVRTDFEKQEAWETICELLRAPVYDSGEAFYAYVELIEDRDYRDLSEEELMALVPDDYGHSFVCVVDRTAVVNPEFPVLIIDLYEARGRSFRAIPSKIQSIENNLSIANMDFEDFAESVDADGIFRGFPK
jgi:hypothetical protein